MDDKLLSRLEKLMDVVAFSTYAIALSTDLSVTYFQETSREINPVYRSVSERNGPLYATLTTAGVYMALVAGAYGLSRIIRKLDRQNTLHDFAIKAFSLYPYLFIMSAKHISGALSWAYS